MEYVLRVDERIRSHWNEVFTMFLGYLIDNRIRRVTSKTVKSETIDRTRTAVDRLIDRVNPQRKWQVREKAHYKCQERRKQLWGRIEVLSLHGHTNSVKGFYHNLLNNSGTRARLEKVREFKSRESARPVDILPEESDMEILSEALVLNKDDTSVFFVSKDEHFCEFSKEIEDQFALKVIRVQDLLSLRDELEQIKQKIG